MSVNRIQKLLFSEYSEFEDMVLVESPFAQTTRDGKGIRQVNLGLTPTKLVMAMDILPPVKEAIVTYLPGMDPDVETFELVAVYPVECLNLSIFHRRKRQSLKAHFCNNKILYFELGGFEKRQMFWNLWCERVKFLSPEDPGSSHSETSVATSTSNSTLYLLSSKKFLTKAGVPQVWCQYGALDLPHSPKWLDRYLYLGKNMDESALNYKPVMLHPTIAQFRVHSPDMRKRVQKNIFSLPPAIDSGSQLQKSLTLTDSATAPVNRFAAGVDDCCKSKLFLPAENYILQRKFSEVSTNEADIGVNKKTFCSKKVKLQTKT